MKIDVGLLCLKKSTETRDTYNYAKIMTKKTNKKIIIWELQSLQYTKITPFTVMLVISND